MDAAEIARLREIAQKATPGPWEWMWVTDYANLENSDGARVMSDGSACGEYGQDIKPDYQDGIYVAAFDPKTTIALLDALEQAQKERDAARDAYNARREAWLATFSERDAALQFAKDARALLREAKPHIERANVPYKEGWIEEKHDLRARIEAELSKP